MKDTMRISFIAAAVLAFVSIQTGCTPLGQRPSWSHGIWRSPPVGLPSPSATIAAAEKEQAAKTPLRPSPANDAASAQVSRGKSLEASGKLDKARTVYEEGLKQNPDSPELAHALGILLDKQGRHADAEECFLLALQINPRNPELLGDLGYCYLLEGRLENAEAALRKATTLDPTNSRYHNNLGLVLGHQKRYDDAFEQFSKTGSEADAFYNMAFVFAAQDHVEEAKGCFQQALAVNQNYQPAREALASFEEFDRLTPEQQKAEPLIAQNGMRYVPYVEGAPNAASSGDSQVQQASAIAPVAAMPANRAAGRATRNLQIQSRGLLGGRMQSERNAQTTSNAAGMQDVR